MTNATFQPLDIVPMWARLNDGMVRLVDYIPDDKLNWSPKPELWNFKGILVHLCGARHGWLANAVRDGAQSPDVIREAQTKEGIKRHLDLSWKRLERFLSNGEQVAAIHEGTHPDYAHAAMAGQKGEPFALSGHWIAYHLLEHDIHHRSDIFHYLALPGIEHPQVGTP